MKFIEIEKHKVKCILEPSEMFSYGVTLDDILSRRPGTFEFMKLIKNQVINATEYIWPGCAFSSEIEAMDDGSIAITFSETIEDFVYNLKQTMIIDESSAEAIKGLIMLIESSDEEGAREVIRSFEENVRKNMTQGKL